MTLARRLRVSAWSIRFLHNNPQYTREQLWDREQAAAIVEKDIKEKVKPSWGVGKLQTIIFEETVETKLRQPTFITEYPAEVSPLARRNDDNDLLPTVLSSLLVVVRLLMVSRS
jgi:lysyl-tRNA synthetase class II